ncbi:serine/threonine-protein kinase [Roseitranquillus sediminis]|uniref:hypothetical protein n=1 Tax=Roseitranquillus sediminis TaxID=2809051 RepID=UPI001D0CCD95|nr:hypothetical protein [Roseitranquillus sediminis]MBM9593569.1 hypothetical protein [Roseitranquillus sediminis]
MTRRSWRDLAGQQATPAAPPRSPAAAGDGDLRRAAELAPQSRLGDLLAQREALERRLRGLTGAPGSEDAARVARFQVMTFAERQAQQRELDARQAALRQRQDALRRAGQTPGGGSSPLPGFADTPLAQRMEAGLPEGTALGRDARSGLGLPALGQLRQGRERIAGRSRAARSAPVDPLRRVQAQAEEVGRPLRDVGRQVSDARDQLADLDRRLAAEGVSEADRAAVREGVGGDTLDKVGARLDKANAALDAPKRMADKIEAGWIARERQVTAPMDRFSSYATQRDRRLSTEFGGSGDLFERMMRNRSRALERRREAQAEEARDRRRQERAQEAGRARRAEMEGPRR